MPYTDIKKGHNHIFILFLKKNLTLIRVGRQTEIYAQELVTLVVAFH